MDKVFINPAEAAERNLRSVTRGDAWFWAIDNSRRWGIAATKKEARKQAKVAAKGTQYRNEQLVGDAAPRWQSYTPTFFKVRVAAPDGPLSALVEYLNDWMPGELPTEAESVQFVVLDVDTPPIDMADWGWSGTDMWDARKFVETYVWAIQSKEWLP